MIRRTCAGQSLGCVRLRPRWIGDGHLYQVGSSADDGDRKPGVFECGGHVIGHFAGCSASVGEQIDVLGRACSHSV